jgi:F0F1-type ATP synthase membrane subunit b/b'
MSKAEKVFVKMVDRTAKKLDLNEEQKIQLEQLKLDIRKNFQEARTEKNEVLMRIKDEAKKENPEIREMTSLLQGMLRDDTERINRTFDLMLDFQTNLREPQEEKLVQMISDWVGKWD